YLLHRNPINKNYYNRQIQERSKLDLTDIIPLSKDINLYSAVSREIHKPNDWYGHATVFKKFLGLDLNYQFKFISEHGVYLCSEISKAEIDKALPAYITYSNYRIKYLKKYKDDVYNIGAFIHYANHYLNKKKL